MSLFNILNSLTAPSGMFWTPDSHRANVRGETSTCRAAFASDSPRDFRNAFSSEPSISRHTGPLLTSAYHAWANLAKPDQNVPFPTAARPAAPKLAKPRLAMPRFTIPQPTAPLPYPATQGHCEPHPAYPCQVTHDVAITAPSMKALELQCLATPELAGPKTTPPKPAIPHRAQAIRAESYPSTPGHAIPHRRLLRENFKIHDVESSVGRSKIADTDQSTSHVDYFVEKRLVNVLGRENLQHELGFPSGLHGWACAVNPVALDHHTPGVQKIPSGGSLTMPRPIRPCLARANLTQSIYGKYGSQRRQRNNAGLEQIHSAFARTARVLAKLGSVNDRLAQVFSWDAKLSGVVAPHVGLDVVRFLRLGILRGLGFCVHGLAVPAMKQQIGGPFESYRNSVWKGGVNRIFAAIRLAGVYYFQGVYHNHLQNCLGPMPRLWSETMPIWHRCQAAVEQS